MPCPSRLVVVALTGLALGCTAADDTPGVDAAPAGDEAGLREALDAERKRSAELEAQLAWTQAQLAALASAARAPERPAEAGESPPAEGQQDRDEPADDSERPWFDGAALAERGLPPSEVARLQRLFDSAQLAEIELTHRATREGWRRGSRYSRERSMLARKIREDLGEEDYDLLLWASGKPNRVVLSGVASGSPGERAGFRPGDVVVSYAGAPIFRGQELQQATTRGQAGERVVVDVLRDGRVVSLRIDRGPIGVRLRPARVFPHGR